ARATACHSAIAARGVRRRACQRASRTGTGPERTSASAASEAGTHTVTDRSPLEAGERLPQRGALLLRGLPHEGDQRVAGATRVVGDAAQRLAHQIGGHLPAGGTGAVEVG